MSDLTLREYDGTNTLFELWDRFSRDALEMPYFQRTPRWNDKQVFAWGKAIIDNAIACLVLTYQIEPVSDSLVYLCDGRHRLWATDMFVNNSHRWGLTRDEALEALRRVRIALAHRHYASHKQAFVMFQNLQLSTPTTPMEYHRGLLTETSKGERLYNSVEEILDRHTAALQKPAKTVEQRHALIRDALAMFFQYESVYTGTSFWDVSQRKLSGSGGRKTPIEAIVAKYVQTVDDQELTQAIKRFEARVKDNTAYIGACLAEHGMTGAPVFATALRWLLHFMIYAQNKGLSRSKTIEKFVYKTIEFLKPYKALTSKFDITRPDGTLRNETLSVDDIRAMHNLSWAIGVPLDKADLSKAA
jgi:hypothetical protein